LNKVADALSRNPVSVPPTTEEKEEETNLSNELAIHTVNEANPQQDGPTK